MKNESAVKRVTKSIGLFGGTFDPVHYGHLIIAESIREQAGLDIVTFIPAANPPHKHYELMFDAKQRFDMLSNAVRDNPKFSISDIEIQREGPSFTIDTIRTIKRELPSETKLSFIVGKDNLYELETWKETKAILEECTILAADRVCEKKHDIPDWMRSKVVFIKVPLIEISSSEIRKRIREGKSIRYLLPDVVADSIEKGMGSRE